VNDGGERSVGMYIFSPETRAYFKTLSEIGTRTNATSREMGKEKKLKVSTEQEAQDRKAAYLKYAREFKEQENEIRRLNPPESIKDEHEELISSYWKFTQAAENSLKALDLYNLINDAGLAETSEHYQVEAASEIEMIIMNMIVRIMF